MSKQPTQPEPDGTDSNFGPLLRYVVILANRYPKPLSQKDVATYARVSEAAVSKVSERLYDICDQKWLARRRRRLVLGTNTRAAGQVFWAFFLSGKLKALVKSPYGKALIEALVQGIYHDWSKALPWIAEFFTSEDILFVSGLIATAVADSVAKFDRPTLSNLDADKAQAVFVGYVVTIMRSLGPNLQRRIKDETTLKRTLEIRDKARFFLVRAIDIRLETMLNDFLDQIRDGRTRTDYLSMYRQTILFYLDRVIAEYITRPIKIAAEKRRVTFDQSYFEIGHFFRPSHLSANNSGELGAKAGQSREVVN